MTGRWAPTPQEQRAVLEGGWPVTVALVLAALALCILVGMAVDVFT